MAGPTKNPALAGTWPLFDEGTQRPFPGDLHQTLNASPGETELDALEEVIVGGSAELLGWKAYARVHAASVVRAVIERGR